MHCVQHKCLTLSLRFHSACTQVDFERVPDLVAQRKVLLRRGTAFVSRHDTASLVVSLMQALYSAAARSMHALCIYIHALERQSQA